MLLARRRAGVLGVIPVWVLDGLPQRLGQLVSEGTVGVVALGLFCQRSFRWLAGFALDGDDAVTPPRCIAVR